jgi:signal transduction histidine kinase
MMRLGQFITSNIEPILVEWEAFARSIWPTSAAVEVEEARDDAKQILIAAVGDMASSQTEAQRSLKSKGRGEHSAAGDQLDAASELHAAARVVSGFKIAEVSAEYRALRASVLRLWRESKPDPDRRDIEDIARFNEAIDQSLSLALDRYAKIVEHSRQMFLAVLSHDLRTPLSAIHLWGTLIARPARDGKPAVDPVEASSHIVGSAAAMTEMIKHLTDFTSATLGSSFPLSPCQTDIARLCREVIEETCAAFPTCRVDFKPQGDLIGTWDPARLRQVVSNLLANAMQHGDPTCVVYLTAREGPDGNADAADPDCITIAVQNAGKPIPPEAFPTLFNPYVRIGDPLNADRNRRPGSLGLGLYIVQTIVRAHGGNVHATSSAGDGTVFTICLPRRADTKPRQP